MEHLLQLSTRLVAKIRVDDHMPAICLAQDSIDTLEDATDLPTLSTAISETQNPSKTKNHELVVWIEACLRNSHGIEASDDSDDEAQTLLTWLIEALLPPDLFGWRSSFAADPSNEVPQEGIQRYRLMSVAGLRALSSLFRLKPTVFEEPDTELFVLLASFTDVNDPWTCNEAHDLSKGLLNRYISPFSSSLSTHIATILQTTIRPVFSKQRQAALAPSGRAALSVPDIEAPLFQTPEAEEKPWKFRQPWVVSVFLWCLDLLDPPRVHDLWPQVTPPMLALMDDGAVPFKVKGCRALRIVISKVDDGMLERTGLGHVFEQALVPMMNLLPPLTEERESVAVLENSFNTLRELANVRFSGNEKKRLKSLDTVMRVGVIRGHSLAGEYPRIGTLLAEETGRLVEGMGWIDVGKHLKSIIPLMVDNLCNPFATAAPDLLDASAKTLQTIILNCWPRIPDYAGSIFNGVAVCWCRICEEEEAERFDEVKAALKDVLKLLRAALVSNEHALKDLSTVLQSDDRLHDLLSDTPSS